MNGCGANRGGRKVTEMEIDYYLSSIGLDASKLPSPSLKLRQKNEQTRQRTSDNRLFGLHFTAYPRALNEGSLTPRTISENETVTAATIDACTGDQTETSPRGSHSESKVYPSLRSTNQVFNDVVIQSKQRMRPKFSMSDVLSQDVSTLPPQLVYATTYNQDWSSSEKAEVKAARKLPYDSTLNSVLGRPRTVYREEFCRRSTPSGFRDQILPAARDGEEVQSAAVPSAPPPRRPDTARVPAAIGESHESQQLSSLRTIRVGTNSVGDDFKMESWLCESKLVAPCVTPARAASARTVPRPPPSAPRKRLEVDNPKPASPRTVSDGNGGTFIMLPRSYFSNRAKYTTT